MKVFNPDEQKRYDEFTRRLRDAPESDWVREGRNFYDKHGYYSSGFLLRLLGDLNERVEISPDGMARAFSKSLLSDN